MIDQEQQHNINMDFTDDVLTMNGNYLKHKLEFIIIYCLRENNTYLRWHISRPVQFCRMEQDDNRKNVFPLQPYCHGPPKAGTGKNEIKSVP